MARWRAARDAGSELASEGKAELYEVVQAEVKSHVDGSQAMSMS
jgi:hypothetical protein